MHIYNLSSYFSFRCFVIFIDVITSVLLFVTYFMFYVSVFSPICLINVLGSCETSQAHFFLFTFHLSIFLPLFSIIVTSAVTLPWNIITLYFSPSALQHVQLCSCLYNSVFPSVISSQSLAQSLHIYSDETSTSRLPC